MLLEIFREIRSETGVRLYDAGDGNGVVPEGEILTQLWFHSGTSGGYVWDIQDASVVSTAVSALLRGSGSQDIVLGLDCEW